MGKIILAYAINLSYNIFNMTISYVYKWTHIPTLKWYVGSRTAKGCHPNDGYICTSSLVKPMIITNPKEWQRTIIDTGTRDDMINLEAEILQLFDAKNDPRSFNKQNGDGKFKAIFGRKISDKTKQKLREKSLGKISTRCSCIICHKEITTTTLKGHIGSICCKNKIKPRISCKFCKKEMQIPMRNHFLFNRCPAFPEYVIPARSHTEEAKQKMSEIKLFGPTVSCLICRREVKFNILGKHQWGSLCKKNSKS